MMKSLSTVLFCCAAVVSMVFLASASVYAAGDNDDAFAQYNATLYLFADQTPTATWSLLPFSSTAVVKQILWLPVSPVTAASGSFAVLFEASAPWIATLDPSSVAAAGRLVFEPWVQLPFGTLGASQGAATIHNQSLYYIEVSPNATQSATSFTVGMFDGNTRTYATGVIPMPQVVSVESQKTTRITTVHDVAIASDGTWWIATDAGLYVATINMTDGGGSVDYTTVSLHNTTGVKVQDSDVRLLRIVDDGTTVLASSREFYDTSNAWNTDLVHSIDAATRQETYYYRAPGIIDATPTALVEDSVRHGVHIINEVCDNLFYTRNGSFSRVAGARAGGLPQGNLTCGAFSPGTGNVWFGSVFGAMVWQPDNTWKYFFGPRWLPGSGFTVGMSVSALAVGASPTGDEEWTLIATDTGMSFIRRFLWSSLGEKAQMYQAELPIFSRYGLMSQLGLGSFGNTSDAVQQSTANDGLWSSLALASQIFRFAATGDVAAKNKSWEIFNGMMLLINVTGDPGYPARSFIFQPPSSSPCPGGLWRSTSMPDFCWEGDTSSDEIAGHLHVYPLMYLLVAETAEEKARVQSVIDHILLGIIAHNLTLIGAHTGIETTWGRWDPAMLNHDPDWYDDRGVNSNQILTYLVLAYAISENPIYAETFWDLVNVHHYDVNLVDLKITQPSDINYSDDELTFLPYVAFLFGSRFANGTMNPLYERIAPQVWTSIKRTHDVVSNEKPSLYNAIFAAAAMQIAKRPFSDPEVAKAVQDGVWWMHTYPLSFVDWPINNMNRLDAEFPLEQQSRSGGGGKRTWTLFPYDELSMMRWNSNPFRTQQGSGYCGLDPSPFLYPFWVGRYFRLW